MSDLPGRLHQRRAAAAASCALALFLALGCHAGAASRSEPAAAHDCQQLAPASNADAWDALKRAAAVSEGQRLIAKHQCTRCHEIDGLPGIGRDQDCVTCHRSLKYLDEKSERYHTLSQKYGRDIIERYRTHITHYLAIPNLTRTGARLRADFIESFLEAPSDQRPLLDESMIRNRLDRAERRALARYFAAVAGAPDPRDGKATPANRPAVSSERIAQGALLLRKYGCPSCHTFGALDLGVREAALRANGAALLAPDLALVSSRMRGDRLVDWIIDPIAEKPDTVMPRFVGSRDDAEAIADFLWFGGEGPAHAQPQPTPAAIQPERPATWAELKERVLGVVCVHCHMDDGEKDRGPGNGGGLGFDGVGLSVRTYAGLMRGAIAADGSRYSVLVPRPGESEAPIVQAVLRRRAENARDHRALFSSARAIPAFACNRPGMPIGLPALDEQQLGLLRRWLAANCPGPSAPSGRPGITNGYLVPDAPIAKNSGCEQR